MREVSVIGVGMTRFTKSPNKGVIELGVKACSDAIANAKIPPKEIQVAYCGHARTGQLLRRECGVGQSILWELGITGIPVASVGNFCSSGSTAFREAWIAVGSGLYDVALAIGVEQLTARAEKGKPLTSDSVIYLTAMGFTPPAIFAEIAIRHMYEYGTTREQIATVAVKNRRFGSMNSRAQYQGDVSLDEVLNSTMIVDPLTLFSCCPTSDGAAAAVLCASEMAKKYQRKPVRVLASTLKSGVYTKDKDITTFDPDVRSSREAYEMAGVGPEDIDVAEVHDCFTIAEIIHYEDLGFCEKGEGGRFIYEGQSDLDGKVVVNPSGGLLSKGHPLGATGLGQIAEIVWQLQGACGKRQTKNPQLGLTHCAGGFQDSIELADGASSTVTILQKDW